MKSGDLDIPFNEASFQKAIQGIRDLNFTQRTFHPKAALIAKELVNGSRLCKEYKGGDFDQNEFEKKDAFWDHEHCAICWFKILDGHTYWQNQGAVTILCDACHEHLRGAGKSGTD